IIAFPDAGANGYGGFNDGGYNQISDRSIRIKATGSLSNVDPRLGTFGNNGGITDTLPLLSDSPAIDAGDPSDLVPTDQRGVARPLGPRPDVGSYEFGLT